MLLFFKVTRSSSCCYLLLYFLSSFTNPLQLPAQILQGDTGPLYLEIITPEEYGGAPVSSKIAEDANGNIYVANQSGTLRFDGVNWHKLPETGYDSLTSAIHIDDKERIWVGGLRHLGYYEPNATGQFVYTDLTTALNQEVGGEEIGVIWDVFSDQTFTYIVTNFHVLLWDGQEWGQRNFDVERRILPSWLDGALYIHSRGSGLYKIEGSRMEKILDERPVLSSGIIRVLAAKDDAYLFATVDGNVIKFNQQERQGGDSTQKIFSMNQPVFAATTLSDGTITLGGSQKDIGLINHHGESNLWENDKIGSVYHSFESNDGSIWAATTKSIARIPPTKYSHFPFESQNIVQYRGELHITDGNELKRLSLKGSTSEKAVLSADGLTNNTMSNIMFSADRYLIYAKLSELVILKDGQPFQTIPVPRHYTHLIQSSYNSNVFYSTEAPEASRWLIQESGITRLNQTANSKMLFNSIVDIGPNTSVFSTSDSRIGILRWPPLEDAGEPPEIEILQSINRLPKDVISLRLLALGKSVLLASNKGFFLYDPENNAVEHIDAGGNQIANVWSDLTTCPSKNREGLIIYAKDDTHPAGYHFGKLRIDDKAGPIWEPINLPGISGTGRVQSLLHEERGGREILWVGGSDNLHRYDLSHIDTPDRLRVNLTSVKESINDTTLYGGLGPLPVVTNWAFPQKSLQINYAAPPAALNAKGYQTRLIGFRNNWSALTELSFREFNNLYEGDYRFEVRAIDEFGRRGPSSSFTFTILPPWYRTAYAYLTYLALTICAFIIIARLWTRHLRKRNMELEAVVQQRTSELERRNLELQEANTIKQDFLASMSHEIRNPLNGILGIAHLLKQEQSADTKRVSHLYTCATHLHQLLGQVLDFSSIQSGKLETRPVSFDPNQLIQEVVDMHQLLAEKKGLTLKLCPQKTDRLWIGDAVLIRQVLINLVSNAVKYTSSGAVYLSMAFVPQNESLRAQFIVEDTGPGIPEDKRDYIFKDFTRLSRAGESEIAGTGLGLAIAKQMAELMRGTLRLDSSYTNGARFLLELPFDTGGKISAKKSTSGQDSTKPLRGKHVLVADDMDFNRYVCRELLEKLGARVTEAEDGQDALAALKQDRFEIAILDINMPKFNGNQVVRQFLDKHAGPSPLFVALTAHVTARMEHDALEAGFQHFIEKPLDPDQIVQIALAQPLRDKKATALDLLSYLAGNDEGSKSRLQARYLKSMRELAEALHSSLAKKDFEQAKAVLHKLRGLANMQRKADIIDTIKELSISLTSEGDPASALEQARQLEALLEEDSH